MIEICMSLLHEQVILTVWGISKFWNYCYLVLYFDWLFLFKSVRPPMSACSLRPHNYFVHKVNAYAGSVSAKSTTMLTRCPRSQWLRNAYMQFSKSGQFFPSFTICSRVSAKSMTMWTPWPRSQWLRCHGVHLVLDSSDLL